MSDRNSSTELLLSFVLGGIVGAVAGILYAPRSGRETRAKLKEVGQDLTDKIEDLGDEVRDKASHFIAEGKERLMSQKERLEDAIDAGKKAYDCQKDRIANAVDAAHKAYEGEQ